MTGGPAARRDWSGRVAVVTGGAGSVGREIVRLLADAGATVVINCFHSIEAARTLAAEVGRQGGRAEVIRGSVARPEQVDRMFDEVTRRHGQLDILVNNAAAGTFAPFDELTEEHVDRALDVNLKGPLWCARAARPLLARSPVGCIVNVSSVGAVYAPANYLSVGVSKAALEALTRYLAAEFAADGIRVNTASAALIDNPVGRMFPGFAEMSANTLDATPMGRLATSADLARVVMLLASPDAGWVTGQTVVADGGLGLLRRALSPDPAPAEPQAEPQTQAQTEAPAEPQPQAPAEPQNQTQPPAPARAREVAGKRVASAGAGPADDPIAVVGMGIAVPGACDPDAFWALLNGGTDVFTEVPADRWRIDSFADPDPGAPDKTYQRRSGFITGFTPHPDLAAEPADDGGDFTVRWLRHSLYQALDGVTRHSDDRYSVCVGYTPDGNQHLFEALIRNELTDLAARRGDSSAALRDDVRALLDRCLPHGRASTHVPMPHRVGRAAIDGILPSARLLMIDTACSSSLYAIDLGVRELLSGRADVALCGGAFALMPSGSVLFSKLHGLSRSGQVRALDRSADGVLFSDGAGVVVLKRLSRALADGDSVHGLIAGVGLSADGRGKAIYAPASSGQELAITRAMDRSGMTPDQVDLIIAHATGTPAGDEAEFLSLRTAYAGRRPVPVTSNKSLIGHTGWAAGVVSVIHALLALRHGSIPAQYAFTEAPASFGMDGTNLTIPTTPQAWPTRPERVRTAAVSGFGFGGTNAHLLLREYRPDRPASVGYGRRRDDPLVIVGWSAHLPEDIDAREWALGGRAAGSFGERYPNPTFQELRMPPAVVRATDRTQLMVVRCMQRLDPAVRALCDTRRERTGVVVGHAGPTRNATLLALRSHLDELDRGAALAADHEMVAGLVKQLREDAIDRIGAPTEDSFPGEMPNVIAARLCNHFDLRGLNMTVDGGSASLLDAFETAGHYLAFDDLDVALVVGVNGNSLRSMQMLLEPLLPVGSGGALDEGAFLFAVTRADVARSAGLPVLAELDLDGAAT